MTDDTNNGISDRDRDSLHILPLSILPIETKGLSHARLIKSPQLDSMVEMFEDEGTGSGQVAVENLSEQFGWKRGDTHPDLLLMRKLAEMSSYDVYSLRISLRENGIKVDDHSALRLSNGKIKELASYMSAFTHPLLKEVFASNEDTINSFADLLAFFRNPDVAKVREKLVAMAQALDIPPQDIPLYLERVGDTFLSISYYRQCTDGVAPIVEGFHESVEDIQGNYQLKANRNLMETCETLRNTVSEVQSGVNRRFAAFDKITQGMWQNPNANQFKQIKTITQECHTVMGRTLCGLSVKMDAWQKKFPNMDTGGPMKRAEFIMQEMKQGIGKMTIKPKRTTARNLPQNWN